jgi:serine/threonine-protein kinase
MMGAALPAEVGVVLLLVVALLALLAERSPEGRWFALVNLSLAATSAMGAATVLAPPDDAARALAIGRASYGTAAIAFTMMCMQLGAFARDTDHPSLARLRRWQAPVVALTLVLGGFCATSPSVVREARWQDGLGWLPVFGPALLPILLCAILTGGWALSVLLLVWRHGSPRRRSEARFIAVGVLFFDWFGLMLLAAVLPRLGLHTTAWSPASMVAGSVVMLAGMVLSAQRKPEAARPAPAAPDPMAARPVSAPVADPSCRACSRCGAVLSRAIEAAHCPLDGGDIVVGKDPWPGRVLDERFTIQQHLGTGGMGRVYRARHEKLGSAVALKLLNADLAADRHAVERFAREARASMRVHSPNVVAVRDLGEVPPGIPFLTMELVEGPSLSALLGGGRKLTARSVALLGRQLAAGLTAAHAVGVLHRDLKPDNVLIGQEAAADTAKIADFGLSKIVGEADPSTDATTLGRVFGTPAYLSPEQAAGRPAEARSDVYAIGVVLYRARSGKKPFEGTVLELLKAHVSDEPPPLGKEPIDELISSLLAKDPARRPEARELVARFDGLTGKQRHLILEGRRADASLGEAATMPAAPTAPSPPRARVETPQTPSLSPSPGTPSLPPSLSPSLSPSMKSAPFRRLSHGIELFFADEQQALATCGMSSIHVLRHPLTLPGVANLTRELRRLYGNDTNRYVALSVIEPLAAHPVSAEVRDASSRLAKDFPISGAAIVVEGSGFRTAAIRSLIAGAYLVQRPGYPHKVFDAVEEGARWLSSHLTRLGTPEEAARIAEAAEQVRASIG